MCFIYSFNRQVFCYGSQFLNWLSVNVSSNRLLRFWTESVLPHMRVSPIENTFFAERLHLKRGSKSKGTGVGKAHSVINEKFHLLWNMNVIIEFRIVRLKWHC